MLVSLHPSHLQNSIEFQYSEKNMWPVVVVLNKENALLLVLVLVSVLVLEWYATRP